jgi:hypothetical protein
MGSRRRSDSYRPERLSWPGGTCTHWETPPLTAHSRDELYNLASDPGEIRNLANSSEVKHRSIRADLARRLADWMERIGDRPAVVRGERTNAAQADASHRVGDGSQP